MNFNDREKKLLILLAILALGSVYFRLFLTPQMEVIKALKTEIKNFEQTYEASKSVKTEIDGMDSKIKVLYSKLKELRTLFPPVMNYDEVLVTVSDIAKQSELEVDNFTFKEPVMVEKEKTTKGAAGNTKNNEQVKITDAKLKEAMATLGLLGSDGKRASGNDDKVTNSVIPNGKAYMVSLLISARGTNEQLKNFLYGIKDLNNKVIFSDIKINKLNDDKVNASITLEFYGIMDRNAGEYTLLQDGKWVPVEASKKDDIFKVYEGYTGGFGTQNIVQGAATAGNNSEEATQRLLTDVQSSDFTMKVNHFGDNMAPPTVTITGKRIVSSTDTFKMPVIYGDNSGTEKVKLFIKEENGVLKCRYETGSEVFPAPGKTEMIEFKPLGSEIKLLIYSSPREFEKDNAGVDIDIINEASKQLLVKVANDDATKPRVKINKTGEKISVEYEKANN